MAKSRIFLIALGILVSKQVREGTLAALVMLRGFLNAVEPLDETNSQV